MTGSVGYHSGLAAEDIVAEDYVSRHMKLASRRWRGQAGEIDLILRDGATVVFVEVKKSKTFDQAATRIRQHQIERICAGAAEYLANEPKGQLTDVRFDLALVDGTGAVKVIENAFL